MKKIVCFYLRRVKRAPASHYFGMVLFLILVWAPIVVRAHISGICTTTDPTDPGKITFYIATYHHKPGAGGSVPGQVHLQAPSGDVSSFDFNTFRDTNPRKGAGMTGAQWISNVKTSFGLPSTTEVACYGAKPSGAATTPPMLASAKNGCTNRVIYTYYIAALTDATSGKYIMWTTNTASQDYAVHTVC